MQQVLHLASFYPGWCDLHGYTAWAKRFDLKTISGQLVRDFPEHRLLSGGKFQEQRHQQPLAFHTLGRALLENPFEQYALVGNVLIDDPQTLEVNRENKRVAESVREASASQRVEAPLPGSSGSSIKAERTRCPAPPLACERIASCGVGLYRYAALK